MIGVQVREGLHVDPVSLSNEHTLFRVQVREGLLPSRDPCPAYKSPTWPSFSPSFRCSEILCDQAPAPFDGDFVGLTHPSSPCLLSVLAHAQPAIEPPIALPLLRDLPPSRQRAADLHLVNAACSTSPPHPMPIRIPTCALRLPSPSLTFSSSALVVLVNDLISPFTSDSCGSPPIFFERFRSHLFPSTATCCYPTRHPQIRFLLLGQTDGPTRLHAFSSAYRQPAMLLDLPPMPSVEFPPAVRPIKSFSSSLEINRFAATSPLVKAFPAPTDLALKKEKYRGVRGVTSFPMVPTTASAVAPSSGNNSSKLVCRFSSGTAF